MSILSGFLKTKKYRKSNDGYQLQSEWTSSETVEMKNGRTLEENLGNITGITDSLTSSSSNIAASAKAVNSLKQSVDAKASSTHNHDSRYYTEAEVNNLLNGRIPTSASCNKNWNWSGQAGQPNWLWGGNDASNMYVYNPANFSVNNASNLGGVPSSNYVKTDQIGTKITASLVDSTLYLTF